ncbi:matrixin family metalloprotease [bacterium]|nr:matrixin family metalloprotease [bacterium]MCI0601603.1 matrixin family metalloprotease [bacterium]
MRMLAAALSLFLCSSAFCFELRMIPQISPNAYLSWDLEEGPIQVSLDSRGSADLSLGQSEQALIDALDAWQGVSNQNMRFHYAGITIVQASSSTDGVNSVQWIESGWQYSSYTLAVTKYSYWLEDPPTLVDADILMNGDHYRWTISNADNQKRIDAAQTLIHELGHLLGISHTSVANAQMFPYLTGSPSHAISKDDKAALRFLYGSPAPYFTQITPIRRAKYVRNISQRGLPLPVFRWQEGSDANYIVEFSNTRSFARKIQVSAGPFPSYALTPQIEKRLLKLSDDKIYWRVVSGHAISKIRFFRFI